MKLNVKAAIAFILETANKSHSLAIAVSHSFHYDKHHSNATLCSSPMKMLNLWKSCVLPYFLLYLGYISDKSHVQTLQVSLNRTLSITLHVYEYLTAVPAKTSITPLYITQNLQLAQLSFRLHSFPPTLFSTYSGNYGSPYYKLCPWTHLKTACRLQYYTWTQISPAPGLDILSNPSIWSLLSWHPTHTHLWVRISVFFKLFVSTGTVPPSDLDYVNRSASFNSFS